MPDIFSIYNCGTSHNRGNFWKGKAVATFGIFSAHQLENNELLPSYRQISGTRKSA